MVKAHGMLQRLSRRADVADEIACQYRKDDPNAEVFPLYTSPPTLSLAQRTWVGLTDAEWMNIVNKDHAWFGQRPEDVAHEVAKLIEAKLKEKNT